MYISDNMKSDFILDTMKLPYMLVHQVGSHKVKMSREPEVSVQAFRKHMRFLRERYGQQVVINLLGTGVTGRSQGEAALSHIFQVSKRSS